MNVGAIDGNASVRVGEDGRVGQVRLGRRGGASRRGASDTLQVGPAWERRLLRRASKYSIAITGLFTARKPRIAELARRYVRCHLSVPNPAMPPIHVVHKTVYRYAKPVSFGPHRLMVRPRDSHDLRVSDFALTIEPTPSLRWVRDTFGNAVGIATFQEAAAELRFESSFRASQFPVHQSVSSLEPHAQRYPFNYSPDERMDLGGALQRHYSDLWGVVDTWARWFVGPDRDLDTLDILAAITRSIQYQFAYVSRTEMGTQDPIHTLTTRSGNCRDFALFMMEAVRSLGFAARFVSGYLCDGPATHAQREVQGGGATHAWVEVYLPGAGWIEFDPTNALIGGENLLRVAVVRDPSQALPVSGTFAGSPGDFLGMTVDVTVSAERGAAYDLQSEALS